MNRAGKEKTAKRKKEVWTAQEAIKGSLCQASCQLQGKTKCLQAAKLGHVLF